MCNINISLNQHQIPFYEHPNLFENTQNNKEDETNNHSLYNRCQAPSEKRWESRRKNWCQTPIETACESKRSDWCLTLIEMLWESKRHFQCLTLSNL